MMITQKQHDRLFPLGINIHVVGRTSKGLAILKWFNGKRGPFDTSMSAHDDRVIQQYIHTNKFYEYITNIWEAA